MDEFEHHRTPMYDMWVRNRQQFFGHGKIDWSNIKPLRKPEREPVPFELMRSRTLIRREAMFDVIERYEPVGGILVLMSVERVPW